VRRCGELCVSHVRSPDYSRCKATEEQASPVAGNGPVPYESLLVPIVSNVPMVPNVLNGLNSWNDLNPVYMRLTPRSAVCDAFSSYGESSGTRYFFAAIFFDDFADGTSLLATNLTVFTAMS
jgi:hypothetical protein